jgi:hypothetical protein
LDEKKASIVVDEIKKAGGEAIAVGGDVGADDFPEKIIEATVKCAPLSYVFQSRLSDLFLLPRAYGQINHIVNNGKLLEFTGTLGADFDLSWVHI